MTKTLTLTDASVQLGVHYMTAYKYVRTGRLAAVKDGGIWVVRSGDLEAFMASDVKPDRRDVTPPMLVDRLVAGDENGSFQIVENAMASGAGVEEVYLDLIGCAMSTIGVRWESGDLSVAQEHVASSTVHRVVARIGARFASRGRNKGTVLLASVSNDFHYFPTAMLRDLLRFRGYNVIDLGANTPATSMIEQAEIIGDDLIAVGLAASTPGADEIARSTISELNAALDVPIIVGGGAFRDADHISSLGNCLPTLSGREALDLFDSIHEDRAPIASKDA